MIEGSTIRGYIRNKFRYNAKMGVYANSSSDIPELYEIIFSNLNDKQVNKILDTISKAWDEQLSVCEICPTRCVSEKDAYCTMFDDKDLF